MPRPNNDRLRITFFISRRGLTAVDSRTKPGETRSDTLRAMLAYAHAHMPK